jgi:hypothetical protein
VHLVNFIIGNALRAPVFSSTVGISLEATAFFFCFFFQAVNFLVESFGLLIDLFSFPPILDAGYPVFDLHLANVLFHVILPSVLGSSL